MINDDEKKKNLLTKDKFENEQKHGSNELNLTPSKLLNKSKVTPNASREEQNNSALQKESIDQVKNNSILDI